MGPDRPVLLPNSNIAFLHFFRFTAPTPSVRPVLYNELTVTEVARSFFLVEYVELKECFSHSLKSILAARNFFKNLCQSVQH